MRTVNRSAARLRRRIDAWPRLPFVLAAAAGLLVLLGAVDWRPTAADLVREVDELPGLDRYGDDSRFTETEMEGAVDIVEYGFGIVTGRDGDERMTLAVRLANPDDLGSLEGTLGVHARNEDGTTEQLSEFDIGWIGAGSETRLTVLFPQRQLDPAAVAGRELVLEPERLRLFRTEHHDQELIDALAGYVEPEPPTIDITGIEELHSPPGLRLVCRIEFAGEGQSTWPVYVFFRDADGHPVGGLPFHRYDRYRALLGTDHLSYLTVPSGSSVRYLEFAYDEIPDGADLDMIDIGFDSW
jgi:catechol 2,3-dioxygenase-like lactoylglutathione lyase family enzyme